jgi:tetratricopeptide (TPR) repeat protein
VGNEYIAAQLASAERPEVWTNLGNFYSAKKDWRKAIEVYRKAIETDPVFVPSYTNLADLYRILNDEASAEEVLREGLVWNEDDATIHHTLGLSLVRQERLDEALIVLKIAAERTTNNPRFIYVYAVALNSKGKTADAIRALTDAHDEFSNNQDILRALISFNREVGNEYLARTYISKLAVAKP